MSDVTEVVYELDDVRFLKLVNADIRGEASESEAEALRSTDIFDRWYAALLELSRSCETQLGDDRALRSERRVECLTMGEAGKIEWAKFLAERDRWRASIIRFKNGIENKITEAKNIRRAGSTNQEAAVLIEAIAAHRANVDEDGEAADDELYKVLEGWDV